MVESDYKGLTWELENLINSILSMNLKNKKTLCRCDNIERIQKSWFLSARDPNLLCIYRST